jgi:hypothetical protein
MQTVHESLEKAASLGAKCALSTFWKYSSLGLLPKGKKIRGRGNALYVTDDTHLRIRAIQFFSEALAIPLEELSRFIGACDPNYAHLLPPQPLSGRCLKHIKAEFYESKERAFCSFLDRLPEMVHSRQKIRRPARVAQEHDDILNDARRNRALSSESA